MPRSRIAAILFDAVGTLIYPEPAVGRAYHAAGAQHGSQRTPDDVLARFQAAFARREAQDAALGDGRTDESREHERWRGIVAEVFNEITEQEALFEHLWQHFDVASNWRLFDDVVPCIHAVHARHRQWGIASNFDSRLRSICRDLPAFEGTVTLFISSELGCRKPHLDFFRAIERQLGLPAERLLLVGDTPENDYYAALAAGWQALLIDRKGRHTNVQAEHRLGSLLELASRLA